MIEFNNFTFKYIKSDRLNIDSLNLEIKKGEVILLTGASGSGKTSVLRILNGLAPSFFEGGYSGDMKVAHLKIGDTLADFSEVIGSVFQNPKNQFFHLDSTSELAFSMENKSCDPEIILKRIEELSKEFSAQHLLNRKILELSGGEKQKLAFMASMMTDADIYILDEITSNLDLESIEFISDIIKKLKDKGKTIIIAEHRIYYLKDLIDRMFILHQGKLIHEFNRQDIDNFDGSQCLTRQINLEKVFINDKEKSNNSNETLMRLENFSYVINKKNININFDFKKGNIYAIVGKNACGKTTFANALTGFINSSGNVFLQNKKLRKKDLLKNTFQVMQDVNYQLVTNSVEKEIKLASKKLENFDLIVDKLGLRNLLDMHPNNLSGGEKQRVAIASALMSDKRILILDEPTSGLDYKNMKILSDLLREISKEEILVLFITHDYEFLCSAADRVLAFNEQGIYKEITVLEENKKIILDVMNKR